MAVIHCVITKQMASFRGKPERWSNGYNLQTTATIDTAYLKSVCDALVAMEKAIHINGVTFPYRVAGLLGQDALYAEEVVGGGGSGTPTTSTWIHPELCALMQSQIGPRKYLMKYYHGVQLSGSAGLNDAIGSLATSLNTNLAQLTNGSLPGAATYCRPNGALATNPFTADPYIRVHQLKRRGKRP